MAERKSEGLQKNESVSDVVDFNDNNGEEEEDDEEELLEEDDSDDSLDEEGNVKTDFVSKLRKKKRQLVKMIISYGPPYTKTDSGEGLVDECSKPSPSLFEIHTMLNNRVTPNYRDPEDFYNSPMHWCARHCTILAMKLLRKAKADVNIQNEFGQTPLHVICMMKYPPSRDKKQMKTIRYMLTQGCDINIRDKAGYCAIDYCAMNGNENLVQLLIDVGAEVLRENKILVASRTQLMHLASNEKTANLLRGVISDTIEEKEAEEQRKRIEKAIAEEAIAIKKRKERQDRKRLEAHEYRKKMAQQEYEEMRARNRKLKMEEEERQLREQRGALHRRFGHWKKIENGGGRWAYSERRDEQDKTKDRDVVYRSARKQMQELKQQNSFGVANARWEKKTGNKLEINWKDKEKLFDIPGLDDDKKTVNKRQAAEEIVDGLQYRDENDAELEGEDIDELLDII